MKITFRIYAYITNTHTTTRGRNAGAEAAKAKQTFLVVQIQNTTYFYQKQFFTCFLQVFIDLCKTTSGFQGLCDRTVKFHCKNKEMKTKIIAASILTMTCLYKAQDTKDSTSAILQVCITGNTPYLLKNQFLDPGSKAPEYATSLRQWTFLGLKAATYKSDEILKVTAGDQTKSPTQRKQ